jgi:predicted O-methyltransferase YrrM
MDDAVRRVREVREGLLAAGRVVAPGDGCARAIFPVAVGREEGRALRDWALRERARRTLEVGLGFGVAALFICEALLENGGEVRHVAVDPYQLQAPPGGTSFAGAGLQVLEEAGVGGLVELHVEESQLVLPRLLAAGRRFDLAFVDGSHRFEAVFLDLVYACRLLEERAVVFVDDTQLPGVRKAVSFGVANLGWSVEEEGAEGDAHAWTVVRTGPRDALRRPYADFVEF